VRAKSLISVVVPDPIPTILPTLAKWSEIWRLRYFDDSGLKHDHGIIPPPDMKSLMDQLARAASLAKVELILWPF